MHMPFKPTDCRQLFRKFNRRLVSGTKNTKTESSPDDIRTLPYFKPSPIPQNEKRKGMARLIRQGAGTVTAVALTAFLLVHFLPAVSGSQAYHETAGTTETAGAFFTAETVGATVTAGTDSETKADESPASTTQSSGVSGTGTAADAASTGKTAASAKAADGPLAILNDLYSIYPVLPREKALALFNSIDCLEDVLDYPVVKEFISFSNDYDKLAFGAYTAVSNVSHYTFIECFSARTFELRICNNNDLFDYTVLASKPMPADYDVIAVNDRFMRCNRSYLCISQTMLDTILKTGCVKGYEPYSNGIYISDDHMVFGFSFYMPERKAFVFIEEDFTRKTLSYTFWQVPNIKVSLGQPCDGSVALSSKTSTADYRDYILPSGQ